MVFNNGVSLPVVGTSGHVLGTKSKRGNQRDSINILRKMRIKATGCPINKNIPTWMSKNAFIKACEAFQSIAEKYKSTQRRYLVCNTEFCLNCKIPDKIKRGERFDPPRNMQFAKVGKTILKRKGQRGQLLDIKVVHKIRSMHRKRKSLEEIRITFPKLKLVVIRNIIKRKRR